MTEAEGPSGSGGPLVLFVRSASDLSKWDRLYIGVSANVRTKDQALSVCGLWSDDLSPDELSTGFEAVAAAHVPAGVSVVGCGPATDAAVQLAMRSDTMVSKLALLDANLDRCRREPECRSGPGAKIARERSLDGITARQRRLAEAILSNGIASPARPTAAGGPADGDRGHRTEPAGGRPLRCPLLLFDSVDPREITVGLEVWPIADGTLLEENYHAFVRDPEDVQLIEYVSRFVAAPRDR